MPHRSLLDLRHQGWTQTSRWLLTFDGSLRLRIGFCLFRHCFHSCRAVPQGACTCMRTKDADEWRTLKQNQLLYIHYGHITTKTSITSNQFYDTAICMLFHKKKVKHRLYPLYSKFMLRIHFVNECTCTVGGSIWSTLVQSTKHQLSFHIWLFR